MLVQDQDPQGSGHLRDGGTIQVIEEVQNPQHRHHSQIECANKFLLRSSPVLKAKSRNGRWRVIDGQFFFVEAVVAILEMGSGELGFPMNGESFLSDTSSVVQDVAVVANR